MTDSYIIDEALKDYHRRCERGMCRVHHIV